MTMILVPAYGRDYRTAAEVKKDWEDGKDFQIATIGHPYYGKYCSISDNGPDFVGGYIRYNRLTLLTFIGKWVESEFYGKRHR